MFGSGSPPKDVKPDSVDESGTTSKPVEARSYSPPPSTTSTLLSKSSEDISSGEKRGGHSPGRSATDNGGNGEKKRRSSGVASKASSLLASAKNSLQFNQNSNAAGNGKGTEQNTQTPLQKLGKQDPALSVPQGQHNNSAGESHPGPRSTFRVGVWEDKNKKCRRTMEDTHAFLYNFLHTPAPAIKPESSNPSGEPQKSPGDPSMDDPGNATTSLDVMETDNGYFAIFDGHAGTFAADWCGKKLHIILEEMIRNNPNSPIPELLDQTFTSVDAQLEKLPLKNSGCTAVTAVLRWEDRVPNTQSVTGSTAIAPATLAAVKAAEETLKPEDKSNESGINPGMPLPQQVNASAGAAASSQTTVPLGDVTHAKLKTTATRQRVLYTANVGDARIVLCRNGKALRLSYDHKGSDENEGKRVANAGGLILNNRVNGVLAVTRALGDSYMKDLVTGHPYTTETVIQPDLDEFIILACDGLWDVCSDQEAVDLVRNVQDPIAASKQLVEHALARFSTDNLSCMIVRFDKAALMDTYNNKSDAIGVEGDPSSIAGKISEVDKIVGDAKRKVQEDGVPGIGVSGSNFGKGHEPPSFEKDAFKIVTMKKVVEEPDPIEGDAPGMSPEGANEISPETRAKDLPEEV